ncbi:MAG TPA: sigma-54-dependent Fis family transcriptional regulator [Candidatus Omnitrophica bacterium]|nr:sigma-54-dependent Fis family transcriptional regulator [Candidatus Omnitrophota bacterium]
MRKEKILIVEDEPNMRRTLASILEEEGYISFNSEGAREGLRILDEEDISLVISDIKMPQMDGIEFLRELRRKGYEVPVILITAYGSFDSAVEALRLGAYDYITKPFNPEVIVHTVARALDHLKLKEENLYLREELERREGFEELVGKSKSMREVYSLILKVAKSKVPVLIRGESGTGKELVARAIHRRSPRRDRRFVVVNCGALPEALLESEIFGYEKGAFTGANRRKPGIFEIADGGTIFLDEIGDLVFSVQMKLLRFLQSGEFIHLGGVNPIKVDVRIISATNKNLERLVEENKFRQDLYYRINTLSIHIPPLRERREDIPLLIEYFLKKYSREEGISPKRVSSKVLRVLCDYPWTGNVRELENLLRGTLVVCEGATIEMKDLPSHITGEETGEISPICDTGENYTLKEMKERVEKDYLIALLHRVNGNVSRASKLAGLSRRHFYDKLRQYSIEPRKL